MVIKTQSIVSSTAHVQLLHVYIVINKKVVNLSNFIVIVRRYGPGPESSVISKSWNLYLDKKKGKT